MSRTRSVLLPLAAGIATLAPRTVGEYPGILEFHPVAAAYAASPPPAERLRVLCTREFEADEAGLGRKGWLTLMGDGGAPAVLFAFSFKKPAKPERLLTTTPRFDPVPTAYVGKDATLEWAWVWDRNGDGRADYLAYLQNAHAVLPDPLPDSFPTVERNADGSFRVTKAVLEAMIDQARMVFRHYADEDADGRADAVVVEEFDAARPMFVRDWVVARSSTRDGHADGAWAFRRSILDTLRVLEPQEGALRLPAIGPEGLTTEPADARLAHATRVFTAVNALVARCGAPGTLRTR